MKAKGTRDGEQVIGKPITKLPLDQRRALLNAPALPFDGMNKRGLVVGMAAVAVLQQYNIDWGSGPPLHYLIADRSGQSALVEFYQGKLHIIPNDKPWHLAANFLVSAVGDSPTGQCPRYDKIEQRLSTAAGRIDAEKALRLLQDVSQDNKQWSIVYGLSTGEIVVALGRAYSRTHTFQFVLTD